MSSDPGAIRVPGAAGLHLHRWNDRTVVGVAVAAFASGFGQFGIVAALGDVARGFGQVSHGATFSDQAGLSGTDLGIGLAIMRLASLGALPITGLADDFGRRRMLLITVGAGLALTVLAAASPSYWWFVAIFACGRPLLSASNGLAQVIAAEQTASADRAKAVALIAAGYGTGAGVIAIVHSLASHAIGFRGVFVLALVPLALLPLVGRWVQEPDRFTVAAAGSGHPIPVLDAVARPFRRRLLVIVVLAFAISVITGPANSFVFLFAQNYLHQPGIVTAGMVVGAGVAGLAGLLAGRWLADRVGRRLTGALAMVAVALFAILTYFRFRPGAAGRLHPRFVRRLGLRPGGRGTGQRVVSHLGPGVGGGLVGGGGRAGGGRRPGHLRGGGQRRSPVRGGRGGHLPACGTGHGGVLAAPRDPRAGARGSLAAGVTPRLCCGSPAAPLSVVPSKTTRLHCCSACCVSVRRRPMLSSGVVPSVAPRL